MALIVAQAPERDNVRPRKLPDLAFSDLRGHLGERGSPRKLVPTAPWGASNGPPFTPNSFLSLSVA